MKLIPLRSYFSQNAFLNRAFHPVSVCASFPISPTPSHSKYKGTSYKKGNKQSQRVLGADVPGGLKKSKHRSTKTVWMSTPYIDRTWFWGFPFLACGKFSTVSERQSESRARRWVCVRGCEKSEAAQYVCYYYCCRLASIRFFGSGARTLERNGARVRSHRSTRTAIWWPVCEARLSTKWLCEAGWMLH